MPPQVRGPSGTVDCARALLGKHLVRRGLASLALTPGQDHGTHSPIPSGIMRTLPASFFGRPTLEVARELIGCGLAIKRRGKIQRCVITETEAYDGIDDLASHAARGKKTKRNEVMFRRAGHIYVYFTYGMHWMLNVVTGPAGYPAAVLIRGARAEAGNISYPGPAKLTKARGITGAFNGRMLSRKTGLWIQAPRPGHPSPTSERARASALITPDQFGRKSTTGF